MGPNICHCSAVLVRTVGPAARSRCVASPANRLVSPVLHSRQQSCVVLRGASTSTACQSARLVCSSPAPPQRQCSASFGGKKCAPKVELHRLMPPLLSSPRWSLWSSSVALCSCLSSFAPHTGQRHSTRHNQSAPQLLSPPIDPILSLCHRRYLSSTARMSPPLPPPSSEKQSEKRNSLFDSESDPESPDSLPNLSESGHLHFAESQLSRDLHYLKSPPAKKVYRIVVEGNIGSGKTTFLKIFAKSCTSMLNKPLIVPEPIELWRNVGGVNIFQLLNDDPKRWSFTFQSYVQLTMINIHEKDPDDGNFKVMERSLFSARYCFVENLLRKGLLQPCEYYVLDEWFKASLPAAQVDLIIYLRSDPDVVYERIKRRARPEETGITLDYLRALHDLHEDWLVREKFPLPSQVLTIDANTPLDQIVSVYEEKTDGILREHLVTA